MSEVKPANTLIQLVDLSCEIKKLLVEHCGEVNEEIDQLLISLESLLPDKCDAYFFVSQDLNHEADLWRKRASQFDKIADALEAHAQKMKDAIKFACIQMQVTELIGNDYKWKLQQAKKKVIIDSPELVPAEFKEIKQEIVIRKDEILKSPEPVPGTHLEESFYVRAYPNVKKLKE